MKRTLYILSILIMLISCRNEKDSSNNDNYSAQIEVIDFDSGFNKWLDEMNLERNNMIDTSEVWAFELWSYKEELTKSDSTFHWYPSKDSSFYLITNFNRETKNRISTENSNDIYLRFLDRKNDDVYIGMSLLDSLEQLSIDFYWYDSTTFFFIESPDGNRERYLTKMKMDVDSIWTYKIEK